MPSQSRLQGQGLTTGRARHVSEVVDPGDLEDQELLLLTREQVEAALDAGEFKVLNWSAAMALALLRS